jgi:hypothetical protein
MIPKLPMANCANYRYEITRHDCALGGPCEPANAGAPMEKCQRGYVLVNRRDAKTTEVKKAISTTKQKISIQEMATKRSKCREAKAQGKPCEEFKSTR